MAKSAKLLPREERIREAVKIVVKYRRDDGIGSSCRDSVANMLDWLEWRCVNQAVLRRNSSKATALVATWLRRGKILLKNLHEWPFGFESFRDEVTRWAAVYAKIQRSPQLQRLTSRTTAYAKLFAAEAALYLHDEFKMKPTTTKRSLFCRLAAALYGEKDANLQKQCRKVLKPDYRTFFAREASNRE